MCVGTVLKVVLDDVRRSRPFMLVLLGERYGWIPPAEGSAAAAREQGLMLDVAGKSVTALEIEYGLMKEDPGRRQRSLILLREPLDLSRLPASRRAEFSDAGSTDPDVQRGDVELRLLKQRLKADPEYAGRVLEYRAERDASGPEPAQQVGGLHAFGELVYQHLWALLDAETQERAERAPTTWQQQERAELAKFVEHRSRLIVGRDALLGELLRTLDDRSPNAPWATVISGAPGLGKSAVFAALQRQLGSRQGSLVLANAAGGNTRGAYVDSMLRRFIEELDAATGERSTLPDAARDHEIHALFRTALHRAACRAPGDAAARCTRPDGGQRARSTPAGSSTPTGPRAFA